jgi:type II secretory pathway predicted ATPase ExeA
MNLNHSFSREIEVASLFLSDQHREAIARLEHVIKQRGFGLLSGEPGTGKSTVIRAVASRLDASKYLFCYINDSDLNPKSLYLYILDQLLVKPFYYLQQLKKQFHSCLLEMYQKQGRQLVIFIDNAQSLPVKTVFELRFLMDFEMDSFSPLALILAGHDELRSMIRLRSFEPVFHCVNNLYFLPALSSKQTKDYIAHHLKLSGLGPLFPDDCISRIFSLSRGIPRLINKICGFCLVDLKINSLELVDGNVLDRVEKDLKI